MELIKANPDVETLKMFLWISFSLLGLATFVIGFFLRRELFNGTQKKEEGKLENHYLSNWKNYTKSQDEKWENFVKHQSDFNNERKSQMDELKSLIHETCLSVQNINMAVEIIKRLDEERTPRIEQKVLELDRQVNSQAQELIYIRAKIGNGYSKKL